MGELMSELVRRSSGAAACNAVMSAVTVAGVLMLLVGALAAHMGSRVGALVFLNTWLVWPLGVLVCGAIVLVEALRGRLG